jgi:hypothetical protein
MSLSDFEKWLRLKRRKGNRGFYVSLFLSTVYTRGRLCLLGFPVRSLFEHRQVVDSEPSREGHLSVSHETKSRLDRAGAWEGEKKRDGRLKIIFIIDSKQ